ncbi:MAG TPA: tetratricopeptide repeat protein [Alloacidobacterium sp.]|nr:tetratricopeptide repeat protein [Alloacidobacterium sp.]
MRAPIFTILAILVLIFSAPAHGQPDTQTQLQSIFREAATAMHEGRTADAEKYFRQATEIAPNLAEAHLNLGLALLKEGKLPEASASIEKAIQLDPRSPGAHMFLGIADYQMNRTDAAIENLQQEIEANPKNPEAQLWLGIVELASGHPEKATGPLDRAAELAPKDLNILDYRGQAHLKVAKQSYAEMYHLDPNSWRVHRMNAELAADAEQHKQAIDEYLAAIHIAPKQADLYEGLGEEYRKSGSLDLAEKAFAQQLELTPGNPVAMYNLGSIRVDRGEEATGVPLLQQVVKIYEKPTVADYYLGRGLAAQGKNDEAVSELQRAATIEGEVQRRALYELAQTYRKMGDTAKARATLTQYQQLRQAAERQSAQQAEDWRKLNTASETPNK